MYSLATVGEVMGNILTIRSTGGETTIGADRPSQTKTKVLEVLAGGALTLEHVSVRDGVGPPDLDRVDRGGGIRIDDACQG